jgi:hypothetical protein
MTLNRLFGGDQEVPVVELSDAEVYRAVKVLTFLTAFNYSDCAV